jgi:hypothetical protein
VSRHSIVVTANIAETADADQKSTHPRLVYPPLLA